MHQSGDEQDLGRTTMGGGPARPAQQEGRRGEGGVVITVVVVDDQPLVRAGVEQVLQGVDDIDVIATSGDVEAAIEIVTRRSPEVVLVDAAVSGIDGTEIARRILEWGPDTAIVMLTSQTGTDWVLRAVDAGAMGYLAKDASADRLAEAIRAAAAGQSCLDPRAARVLIDARRSSVRLLSEREQQVLSLVAVGLANKQIARRLAISEKTVKGHLTRVFTSIGVSDRTQAALWAVKRGLTAEPLGPIVP
jgi:DNA-binding NarL/FixJ family response regulator